MSFVQCQLHLIHEFIDGLNLQWPLMWFETHSGMSTGVKEKQGMLCHSVDVVVVCELTKGE
jgi:hypothetical protein